MSYNKDSIQRKILFQAMKKLWKFVDQKVWTLNEWSRNVCVIEWIVYVVSHAPQHSVRAQLWSWKLP